MYNQSYADTSPLVMICTAQTYKLHANYDINVNGPSSVLWCFDSKSEIMIVFYVSFEAENYHFTQLSKEKHFEHATNVTNSFHVAIHRVHLFFVVH